MYFKITLNYCLQAGGNIHHSIIKSLYFTNIYVLYLQIA
jgi:hypothetical protein